MSISHSIGCRDCKQMLWIAQAGKCWKAWRKRGSFPREWEANLKEVWLNDEALWNVTEKSKWKGYR